MSRRARQLALVAFFAGLAALEIAHGASRFGAVRERRRAELLGIAEDAHRDLALEMRSALDTERRHASYLAKAPWTRRLVSKPDDAAARAEFERQLLAYLASFERVDSASAYDDVGRELAQCRRIGGGVGAIPRAMAPKKNDLDAARASSFDAPRLLGFAHDAARVEVPESERQVALYAAAVRGDGGVRGAIVLGAYATPLLNRVRTFAPVPGASAALIDAEGKYLASADRDRERGGPREGDFRLDDPAAAKLFVDGDPKIHGVDGPLRATLISEDPPLRLVTRVDTSALDFAAAEHVRGEATRIAIGTTAVMIVLAGALFFFLRLAERAAKLRETELELRELERRRGLERRLATAERLSSLGLMTAGVAHEINNPLAGIGNYLALLERSGADPEKRARYVASVRHGFERIRSLVNDLLSFGRPGSAGGSCEAAPAIGRAIESARLGGDGDGVAFENLSGEASPRVACDAGRFEQVFLNLFLNAARAIRSAGRTTGRVVVRSRTTADADGTPCVAFDVEDDGPGVPADVLPRIFDPFFTTGAGTGLGLAVTHGIVRAHGGEVTVENRAEGGARFVVVFPAADSASEAKS